MKDIASGIGALGETASMLAPVGLLARFGASRYDASDVTKSSRDFFALPVGYFKAPTDDGKGFINYGSQHDFEEFDLGKIGTEKKINYLATACFYGCTGDC